MPQRWARHLAFLTVLIPCPRGFFLGAVVLSAFAWCCVIQDLVFILTMLTAAQRWSLIAGFGGMASVGQRAFVRSGV